MSVPFMDLARVNAPVDDAVRAAVLRVLGHRNFILGKEVEAFESLGKAQLDGAEVIGVSSGTDALLVALMALGVERGDDVATTPFSFFATAGTVVRLGARPVLVDIEPTNFGMDARRLSALNRSKLRAVLPVHLFGAALDLDPILSFARDIPVLEDAAQAVASRDKRGRLAGTIGRVGAFSFFPTKNLGALGDAGMVATRDPDLAARLRRLRAHGQSMQYRHEEVGGNFRLDAIQAAGLAAAWPHLGSANAARRRNAKIYEGLFAEAGLSDRVVLPQIDAGHTVHQYVIRVLLRQRDRVQSDLKAMGIGSMVYYPIPFHLQPCFEFLGYKSGDFPESERAAAEVLALPIFPGITEKELAEVVSGIQVSLDKVLA